MKRARVYLPRVYLRRQTLRDCDAFLDAAKRSRKLHRPWMKLPADRARFKKYLKRKAGEDHESFFVCRTEDRAIVGMININNIVRGSFHSAYLGYCAFAPFNSSGYMTEGLRLVMAHAFMKMKLHRLEANIQPTNAPSIALAKCCGFVLEGLSKRYLKIAGEWRDHERWAITIEQWKKAGRKSR